MSNSSALIGKPPQTIEDYWIIKGMLRAVHKDSTDPEKGYLLFPKAPEGYQYEDKGADIMIGLYITGILMLFVTCVRLGLRLFRSGLRWGADDWLLIPGAVRMRLDLCQYSQLTPRSSWQSHIQVSRLQ